VAPGVGEQALTSGTPRNSLSRDISIPALPFSSELPSQQMRGSGDWIVRWLSLAMKIQGADTS